MDTELDASYLVNYYTFDEILALCEADRLEILMFLIDSNAIELPLFDKDFPYTKGRE